MVTENWQEERIGKQEKKRGDMGGRRERRRGRKNREERVQKIRMYVK